MRKKILHCIEKLPLFGGLINCRRIDFWNALVELVSKQVVSLLPVLSWFFVMLITKQGKDKKIIDIFIDSINHGELFLYCTSLLAPIFYMALVERKTLRTFHNKLSLIIVVTMITTISTIFFILNRKGESFNISNVITYSIIFYFISLSLIYAATVYNNSQLNPSAVFQNEEDDFINKVNQHRG